MTTPRRYQLTAGALMNFNDCGEAFRRRWIKGHRPPKPPNKIVRQAVLDTIHADLAAKLETSELLAEDVVAAKARDAVDEGWKFGVDMTGMNDGEQAVARGLSIDRAIAMAKFYHEAHAPHLNLKAVKRPFTLRLDDLFERNGIKALRMDLTGDFGIEVYGTTGVEIHGLMTSKRSPDAGDIDENMHLSIAAMAMHIIDGQAPGNVTQDTIVELKGGLKMHTASGGRGERHFAMLFNRIANFAHAFKFGIFPAASTNHYQCAPKQCGYWYSCPFANHDAVEAMMAPAPQAQRKMGKTFMDKRKTLHQIEK